MCRFHHQALVELKILDVIKRKDKDNLHNVIHMKEYFYFRNHLCISFELLGSVSCSCTQHNRLLRYVTLMSQRVKGTASSSMTEKNPSSKSVPPSERTHKLFLTLFEFPPKY